jgi:hypothetical protein
MACGEIVRAVEHDIDGADQIWEIFFLKFRLQGKNLNLGIECAKRRARSLYFGYADGIRAVKNLPLQVGEVDLVRVGEGEFADAAGGEVERRRASQAAGADDERMRRAQPLLALDPYLIEQDVAAVAEELLVVQTVKVSSFSRPAWSARPRASGP